jgi:MoaA/NifB/PqqE/SkfB family radical SAM enzyme
MPKNNKITKIFLDYLQNLIKVKVFQLFPILYSNIAFKPKTASLNITDNCNLRCIMCKQWREIKIGELNTEEWKDIIEQLKNIGIEKINFSGGEPLLRHDVFELIKYASEGGIICGLTTNGYLLNKQTALLLINSGIKIFTISIDGVGDSYEQIRGIKGAFKKIENAARLLSSFRQDKGISVNVSFVLMKPTLNYLLDVLDFCKILNLPLVICLIDRTPYLFDLESQKNLWIEKEDYLQLERLQKLLLKEKIFNSKIIYSSFSDISFFKNYFKDPIQKRIPCIVSQTRIFIDSRGNVFGGCWSMGSFGNLKDKSLKDIINSTRYKRMHRNMFFKACLGCSCGYSDNLRFVPLRRLKDRIKALYMK